MTPLECLYLDLNLARARYTQVLTGYEALRVAAGDVAELDFYALFPGTPEQLRDAAVVASFAQRVAQ